MESSTATPRPEKDRPHPQAIVKNNPLREQWGLALEHSTEYDRLMLSLQSPLPNEQDLAISVCTLLSNETKHALKLNKGPGILELLMAHAGIFNHCDLRQLMEETYSQGRGLEFSGFWNHVLPLPEVRELLCECALERYQSGYSECCSSCPCEQFRERDSDSGNTGTYERDYKNYGLNKFTKVEDKIGQRVTQVASIIRNLSFDRINAEVMSQNTSILRFRVLRSLETLREWSKQDANEYVLLKFIDKKCFLRLCELLTISDIMMLIYTLECLLSLSSLGGEQVCNEISRVQGSVETLISLVTVEAQSYGPKGCIHMRVVETVVGHPALLKQPPKLPETQPETQPQSLGQPPKPIPLPLSNAVRPGSPIALNTGAISVAHGATIIPSSFHGSIITDERSSSPAPNHVYSNTFTVGLGSPSLHTSQISGSLMQVQPPSISPSSNPISPNTSTIRITSPKTGGFTPITSLTSNSVTVTQNGISATHLPAQVSQNHQFSAVPQVSRFPIVQQTQSLPVVQPQPQVYTPTISIVSSQGVVNEEAWAGAWMKAAFEQVAGSSIEQGEMYRMYSNARKNQALCLSETEFIACVKCTYGDKIGPVIKNFSGTPLKFLDGIRPRMTTVGNIATGVPIQTIRTNSIDSNSSNSVLPNAINNSSPQSPLQGNPSSPVTEETIPTKDKKTTSPILKATLSRPPRTKNSVAQRQQKKLLQGEPKSVSSKGCRTRKANGGKKKGGKKDKKPEIKVNGIEGLIEPEGGSSANSFNSIDGSESINPPPLISFQGVLRNGLSSDDSSKGENAIEKEDMKLFQNHKMKGMLVDLLERKVTPTRETVNGVVGNREIRISDRGLELIEKMEPECSSDSSNLSAASLPPTGLLNNNHGGSGSNDSSHSKMNSVVKSVSLSNDSNTSDSQSSQQQMTFYSVSDTQSQVTNETCPKNNSSSSSRNPMSSTSDFKLNCLPSSELVLMSGVGGSSNGNDSNNGGGSSQSSESKGTVEDNENENDNLDDSDFLEKFNEISDLIVIPPEQLGLKRTHSMSEDSISPLAHFKSQDEPPAKKYCESSLPNGNGCPPLVSISDTDSGISSIGSSCNSPNVQVLSSSSPVNHVTKTDQSTDSTVRLVVSTSGIVQSTTTAPANLGAGTRLQLPGHLRLVSNTSPSTPNQYAFTRQLVITSNQQILLQSPSQTNLQGAQVLISKPSNSSNDQMAKAIIILQPQNQQPGQISGTAPTGSNTIKLSSISSTTNSTTTGPISTVVSNSNNALLTVNTTNKLNPSRVLSNSTQTTMVTRNNAFNSTLINNPQDDLDREIPYLCEWVGCGMRFINHQQVLLHALHEHAPESLTEAIRCEWGGNGCDALIRRRFSLMTHLQDRHCCKPALELALYRRLNKIEPPQPIHQPLNHPGYAPNAAFHAIKRHALQFMNSKERLDDNEGPVTKSIRLTSALILKNLCNYSSLGRRIIRRHESHLASIAMSNVESSRTIAQLLYDMDQFSS